MSKSERADIINDIIKMLKEMEEMDKRNQGTTPDPPAIFSSART